MISLFGIDEVRYDAPDQTSEEAIGSFAKVMQSRSLRLTLDKTTTSGPALEAINLFTGAIGALYLPKKSLYEKTFGQHRVRIEASADQWTVLVDGKPAMKGLAQDILSRWLNACATFYDVQLQQLSPRLKKLLAASAWGVIPKLVKTPWLEQRKLPDDGAKPYTADDREARGTFQSNFKAMTGGELPVKNLPAHTKMGPTWMIIGDGMFHPPHERNLYMRLSTYWKSTKKPEWFFNLDREGLVFAHGTNQFADLIAPLPEHHLLFIKPLFARRLQTFFWAEETFKGRVILTFGEWTTRPVVL